MPMDREPERLALLAALVAAELGDHRGEVDPDPANATWMHTGHPHKGGWAWSNHGAHGWRGAARLENQGQGWPGRY